MKKLFVGCFGLVVIILAANLNVKTAPTITVQKQLIETKPTLLEAECINTGSSTNPPWLQLNPPWDPNVLIPDVYHRNDELLSMAVDVNGRIYVAYQTPWTGTGAGVRYGWGLATSTDQGQTWDNRVYRVGSANYTELYPEIAITADGKIYLWGTLHQAAGGTSYIYQPAYMRSSATCYNNPDSLRGFLVWNVLVYRMYPEVVTWGNGNQFIFAQYTADRTGSNDTVTCLFSYDSTAYYFFNLRPPGGNPGMTSVSVDVSNTDTILIHAIEYFDATGNDWDVVWYLDTLNGSGNFYGWATGNVNNDRFPSVFSSQGYSYLAIQSNNGGTDEEILLTNSTDYGASWDAFQNLSNDGAPDVTPRVHGVGSTIGCAWIHGNNQTFFNYSINNGQPGTWQGSPEIVTTSATADTGYHCVALQYTPNYYYAAWEDTRNFATDSVEIYTSRRVAPIGVAENRTAMNQIPVRVSPNPTASTATIRFNLIRPSRVDLSIYDASGRLVRNLIRARAQAGDYAFTWNRKDDRGQTVPNGVYFGRLTTDSGVTTRNLILLK
jgi:hypothetical protein